MLTRPLAGLSRPVTATWTHSGSSDGTQRLNCYQQQCNKLLNVQENMVHTQYSNYTAHVALQWVPSHCEKQREWRGWQIIWGRNLKLTVSAHYFLRRGKNPHEEQVPTDLETTMEHCQRGYQPELPTEMAAANHLQTNWPLLSALSLALPFEYLSNRRLSMWKSRRAQLHLAELPYPKQHAHGHLGLTWRIIHGDQLRSCKPQASWSRTSTSQSKSWPKNIWMQKKNCPHRYLLYKWK